MYSSNLPKCQPVEPVYTNDIFPLVVFDQLPIQLADPSIVPSIATQLPHTCSSLPISSCILPTGSLGVLLSALLSASTPRCTYSRCLPLLSVLCISYMLFGLSERDRSSVDCTLPSRVCKVDAARLTHTAGR